jgi:hypothetical protein
MRSALLSFLLIVPSLFAQGGANCHHVGGSILTNFIDQTHTLGSATGDLKGGLGVNIIGPPISGVNGSIIFHNHHQWVTDSGETISFADADATAFPTMSPAAPALLAVSYLDGVTITGGTGRYAGASGKLAVFGAVDMNQQHLILRYEGQVCTRPVQAE